MEISTDDCNAIINYLVENEILNKDDITVKNIKTLTKSLDVNLAK